MSFIYHKPGVGSWLSFEDGLPEYKEAQLKVEWWYTVTADKPFATKGQRRRARASAAATLAGAKPVHSVPMAAPKVL